MKKALNIVLFLILAGACFLSCSPTIQTRQQTIAYVDLRYLYLYVLDNDEDFRIYKDSVKIRDFGSEELDESEIEIKKSVLLKVDSAVRFVSRERNIDVVLNKSDSLVYAENSLDLTQAVIVELKERYYRNSPASR